LSVVDVRAAALTNLDVAVAEGRHYFSPGIHPAVVGREAVVLTADGVRLFLNCKAIPIPFGSMAERAIADLRYGLPVPDGVSDALAAALGNAGLAAWLAVSWRAKLQPGEKALVLGATGTSGRIAVAAASILGAGHIVAVGRDQVGLEKAKALGAHEVVALTADMDMEAAFRHALDGRADVVLDFLNGPPAEAALQVMATGGRMVQSGSMLARGIHLPAQLARRESLDVLGFAYYHAPLEEQINVYERLCLAAMDGRIEVDCASLPLADFSEAWRQQKSGSKRRFVLHP
jgi:NADPH2:quinone reductase